MTIHGTRFASKLEARRYQELVYRWRAHEITRLIPHPSWDLIVNGCKIGCYTADASYIDTIGRLHVVDFKSEITARGEAFRLRKKLMWACHGIEVEVIL